MKTFLIGIGAAGNKAVYEAVESGIINEEDTCIVNSTTKDFPKEYSGKTIVLSDGDTGCGKERSIAMRYAKKAISDGKFNLDMSNYKTVVIATSVEGGTGSGATPLIAKFFKQVFTMNVHIIAFKGFEDDIRGMANTVEFFKEINDTVSMHIINNASFLAKAGNNKLRAEELANKEMVNRISVITGQDFIEGTQNIDDTDILKLANTVGYMTVEKKLFDKSLETRDDFEKVIKNMIYNSGSLKVNDPSAVRMGVILNISPASEDAIDYTFESLKKAYGNPYEFYTQVQWDNKKEYIAYIASGMKMPLDEIKAVYNNYLDQTSKINKNGDEFFVEMEDMKMLEEDSSFDMIKSVKKGMNIADFLNNN